MEYGRKINVRIKETNNSSKMVLTFQVPKTNGFIRPRRALIVFLQKCIAREYIEAGDLIMWGLLWDTKRLREKFKNAIEELDEKKELQKA